MATAFAVYSADDNSLNFYKRDSVPTAGSSFNGKTATEVYTGIETDAYTGYPSYQPWKSYQSSITSVSIVDEGIAPVSTAWWFYNMNNASLTTISWLDKLDTSNVTNMGWMFRGCSSLTSLDLSNFDTANVTNMVSMFQGCSNLTSLDLSNFNTANVTDMSYMFQNCTALTSLDVSNFDTANVTNMSDMFNGCSALISLDLSHFDTANVTNMGWMFYGCSALSAIYAGERWSTNEILTSTGSKDMFSGCSKLPNFDSSVVDKTNAHYNSGGYLRYISAADKVKVILEKGAVDIIVDKIKNAKSGPTISASGDTLTITN